MPTNRSRRTRALVPGLSDSLKNYLETGDYCAPAGTSGRAETFMLASPSRREELQKVWQLHRQEIWADWKKQKRPGMPWAAKEFD